MKKEARSREFSGFLDSGTTFSGELHFEGTLRVDGEVSGTITTPDVLIVGSTSTVRADVTAGSVQIHGRIIGDVTCASRVEICPGGHLQGNVQTPRLVIEEGGNFEGQSKTTEEAQSENASQPTREKEEPRSSALNVGDTIETSENSTRWGVLSRQLATLRGSQSQTEPHEIATVHDGE